MSKSGKLFKCLQHAAYRNALTVGVAAGVEHERLLENLPQCRAVVDIGANRGQFALVARRCFPEATIISFEPLEVPAAKYRRVFAADPAVNFHQVAIAAERGETTMHLAKRDDASSLLAITDRQSSLFPGTHAVSVIKIRTGQLGDFVERSSLKQRALLKLDVQGFELNALKGCESVLDAFDFAYVECSFVELYKGQALADQVIAWLHERGLRLSSIHNVAYDKVGRAIQADLLFAR